MTWMWMRIRRDTLQRRGLARTMIVSTRTVRNPKRRSRKDSTAPTFRLATSASPGASTWLGMSGNGGHTNRTHCTLLGGCADIKVLFRKHTGERPFECHCGRRFSRLDNLRQHAQTVHVNEEIPVDSLAATGTRFQRQIRTDRMRQPGRARASTAGSVGPGGRGHAKSLSTSSIASVGSIASAYSVNEPRRRPPRLIMADARPRLSLEPYRDGDGRYYRAPSPGDFSTPTSATFSTGQNSPRWSAVMSPGASHSRSHSMYAGSRTPVRRLSVPSGGNPFQSPHGPNPRGSFFGAPMLNSSNSGAFSPSQASLSTSPTITPAYGWTRRESTSSAADEAWRRRTWHPDTRDYSGSSRLSQVITPHQFPPITPPQIPPDTVTLPAANPGNQPPQPLRLPGIESFDEISRRPPSPLRGNPSAMMVDPDASRPRLLPGGDLGSDDRRALPAQWDSSLHRGLTKLDLGTPPRDGAKAWENEGAGQALLARADQALVAPAQPIVRFEPDIQSAEAAPVPMAATGNTGVFNARHQHTMSAPSISAARASKRHGWYCGPVAGGTIHEGRPHVDRIVHPNISEFQGFPAREQPPVIHQQTMPNPESSTEPRTERIDLTPPSNGNPESLRRLEALVAVATSEGSVAAAY